MSCGWIEDADGNWDTECENKFTFTDGTPQENGFTFCPYCGSSLCEIRHVED